MFNSLPWEAWTTLIVLLGVVIMLAREWIRPDLVLLGALTVLLITGVVSPEVAFVGFSSSAVLSIAALYVVAAGIQRTDALAWADRLLFSSSPSLTSQIARLGTTTAALSAVVNNTPLVAILIPRLQQWATRHGVPVSKVMIPLSYAAVLGGLLTLIGTSTNLVVTGLLRETTGLSLSLFAITWVGLPAAAAGILYLAFVAHRLLPARSSPAVSIDTPSPLQYHFPMVVSPESDLIGHPVEHVSETNDVPQPLRVERASAEGLPSPSRALAPGDVLHFEGPATLVEKLHSVSGLSPLSDLASDDSESPQIYEVVLSGASALIGHSLPSPVFRDRYRATPRALHRREGGFDRSLLQTPLRAGDLLLLEAPPSFYERWLGNREDFYFIAPYLSVPSSSRRNKAPFALAILAGMVLLTATGLVPLLVAALTAALALLATGCLRLEEARRSVDLPVLIMIGSAFGLSQALQSSGLAALLASSLLNIAQGLNLIGALLLLYVLTNLLTELLTNAAAAALAVPIALELASALHADPVPFALVVAVAASAGFATPFGYQTNLMVMSVGGYRFGDYVRTGLPLNVIVMVASLLAVWAFWL